MKGINPNYIVGLVDGKGSFTVYVKNPDSLRKVKRRTKVEPRFFLKLNERDKTILFDLKKFFGCGNVYFQKDSRPNHSDCYRYEVANRQDLKDIIIPFFEKNPLRLMTKAKDFKIFCRILKMVLEKKHLKETGLRRIYEIKQRMH
ncbi:MAG: LAGLIDADG family homing endonuclease [Patescibacteria group bacterium]|nr:LAGLIDADG family homing endonuclease [Patescibacteria group bacterium]